MSEVNLLAAGIFLQFVVLEASVLMVYAKVVQRVTALETWRDSHQHQHDQADRAMAAGAD